MLASALMAPDVCQPAALKNKKSLSAAQSAVEHAKAEALMASRALQEVIYIYIYTYSGPYRRYTLLLGLGLGP